MALGPFFSKIVAPSTRDDGEKSVLLNTRWSGWWHSPTTWLLALALLYALPSLAYPFGRDQAYHYYIGRWWLEGLLPYRDSFDSKPPFLFALHALAVWIFGPTQLGIRIMDLVATVSSGIIVAFAVRRDRSPVRGELGAIILMSVSIYYTCFDYWDTAQSERFEGLMLAASYLSVVRIRRLWLASSTSGALSACAILFKLPAILPALGIALLIGTRVLNDTNAWGKRFKQLTLAALAHLFQARRVSVMFL